MTELFSQKTQEELKSYVYILIDPRDNKIFYVGKGYGNRVFSHINEAIFNPSVSEKLETIRAIKTDNLKVKHFIVKHGLEEKEALIVESVLIDFLTFRDFAEVAKISNIVAGHNSFNQGIKTVNECEILYNCEELKKEDIKHKVLVININKTYDNKRKKKSANPVYDRPNIYEATRGWWVLDKNRAENSEFVLAEYKGVIRAIFKPEKWVQDIEYKGTKRWGFEGSEITAKEILDIYMNKEVPKIRGMANPIRYFEKI
ncbi:excinuclease ABC [Flavobacterium sp.]|uniref:LEM-3-like GIY-YIG domain-containing protein n=1 Tax=Flavobacterium sp. TaxID=239 RepID=UPI002618BE5A|nr:excinuclease ABC [Flavobacterium sp.]MDG2431286.1 excinuclease ABC [Flavobacterium sp.]